MRAEKRCQVRTINLQGDKCHLAMRIEAQWTRIFDRFDIFAMIVYQTINVIMFIVVICI